MKILLEKSLKFYQTHKEFALYIIFGVLTTIVNFATYFVLTRIVFSDNYLDYYEISTLISWFVSVLFAYVTNRKYVFESKVFGFKDITIEIIKFFSCRVFSGVIDILLMILLIDIFTLNDLLSRILCNILVIIINYIFSKLIIFKK